MNQRKKAQQEIVGFVLIVLIVTIIGIVLLVMSIGRGDKKVQNSVEISNLLEAGMYYTSDCATNYAPYYLEVQELIKQCEGDRGNNKKKCLSKIKCEEQGKKYTFSFAPTHGPWEHLAPSGNALQPLLVASSLRTGDEIFVSDIDGFVIYKGGSTADCRMGATGANGYGSPAIAGFYNDNKKLISEHNLRDFENGMKVPSGATRLYVYIKEYGQYIKNYNDNTGECSFNYRINRQDITACEEVKDNSEISVCSSLSDTLKRIVEENLRIGGDATNKAYRMNIYYETYSDDESENSQENNTILYLEQGNFENCNSIPGGSHTLTMSDFSSGVIIVELELCAGNKDSSEDS